MTFDVNDKTLVLFDLDGVIIDSRPNMEKAWEAVCQQTGRDVEFDRYFALIGRSFSDIMEKLGLTAISDQAEMIFRITSMQHLDLAGFFEGASDTLVALQKRGIKLGIVTSKDKLRTNAILAMLPVDFTVIQTPNRTLRGKPAPDHLLVAMANACTDPANSIYIGDMDPDYEAAERAGIDYLHASWGYGERPASSVRQVDTFRDISRIFGI